MITARNTALEKNATLNRLYVKRKKDDDDALLALCTFEVHNILLHSELLLEKQKELFQG